MNGALAAPELDAVVVHPDDDVAVLTRPAEAGAPIAVGGAVARTELAAAAAIPAGHKVALRALAAGQDVRKHGHVIGRLVAPAQAGAHVHVHNLRSLRADGGADGRDRR